MASCSVLLFLQASPCDQHTDRRTTLRQDVNRKSLRLALLACGLTKTERDYLLKLEFHGTDFFVASYIADMPYTSDFLARMPACRACLVTFPSSMPRAYPIGWPPVCCGIVLPVCPCVVSFFKVHEHHTFDCYRHPREDPRADNREDPGKKTYHRSPTSPTSPISS